MTLSNKIRSLLAIALGIPTPAERASCRVCGRQLTNPKSVAAGIGSCCAKKSARDDRTLDIFEAGTPGSEG
jgi:hypothetical protein